MAIASVVLIVLHTGCQRWIEARTFVWPTPGTPAPPPGVEELWIDAPDGLRLHAWWIPARGVPAGDGPAPTVLHVHGNAGHLGNHLGFTEWLADAGFNVMLFDYRGYGRSDTGSRRPARDELIADTHAALDAVLARDDVDPERVALFGFSMGGAVVLAGLTERDEPAAFVAAAPFSTWRGVASDHAGIFGRILIGRGAEPVEGIARLGDRPLLIVHGEDDQIVPIRHLDVFASHAETHGADLVAVSVRGADHNDLMVSFPRVRDRIERFLEDATAAP